MHYAIDLPMGQRRLDRLRKLVGLDHAVNDDSDNREGRCGNSKIPGAVFPAEVDNPGVAGAESITQQFGKIISVPIRGMHFNKSASAGGLCGMPADREGRERRQLEMARPGLECTRRVCAGHHNRLESLVRQIALNRLEAQHGGNEHIMPVGAQSLGGTLCVGFRPGDKELHIQAGRKKSVPALARSSRPASVPMRTASATDPSRSMLKCSLPSGFAIRPRKYSRPAQRTA